MPSYRGIDNSTISLAYDADNRLQSASKKWPHKQNVAEYFYDAFNRRVAKRVMEENFDPSHSKVAQRKISTRFFVWDGDNLLQEIEQDQTTTYVYEPESFVPVAQIISHDLEEIYAKGTVYLPHIVDWDMLSVQQSANAHVIDYDNWQGERKHTIIRNQREAEAERNAKNDQRHFYQCDHLGTPLDLLNSDGNTVWTAKYKAWGGLFQNEIATTHQPLRFQGQYFDAETGLHYNRHRYYDPETARFVTQDPIGLPGGVNFYIYSINPINWVDPVGLTSSSYGSAGRKPKTGKPNIDNRCLNCNKWAIKRYDRVCEGHVPGVGQAKFFRDPKDGAWYSVDQTGHGGSAFKQFEQKGSVLNHAFDLDEFGDRMGKHKGEAGKMIDLKKMKCKDEKS